MNELTVSIRKNRRNLNAEALLAFAKQAQKAAQLKGSVNVLITGDDEMQTLNRRFRRKNTPTDVLSFPGAATGVAGDIAVSANIAAANAKRLGHALQLEIQILLLHGMLHLAGWDHENDAGEMRRKESALRKRFGLPDGLITRTEGQGLKAARRTTK